MRISFSQNTNVEEFEDNYISKIIEKPNLKVARGNLLHQMVLFLATTVMRYDAYIDLKPSKILRTQYYALMDSL